VGFAGIAETATLRIWLMYHVDTVHPNFEGILSQSDQALGR